jgi:hypothetical protein
MVKLCHKCGRFLPVEQFPRDATAKDGLNRRCRECMAQYKKGYRHRSHVRELQKEYKLRHYAKPEVQARLACERETNRREREAKQAQHEAWLVEVGRELQATWDRLGGEEYMSRLLSYRERRGGPKKRFSEEEMRFRRMIRDRWKYRTNPQYLLKSKLAARLRAVLKRNKGGRRTFDLLPYTPEELVRRLMRTIPPGYTWQDFLDGKLHIDHIIPVRAFNFTRPEHPDFQRCWALVNLQLLPASENIRKRDKVAGSFQPCLPLVMPKGTPRLPGSPDPPGNHRLLS